MQFFHEISKRELGRIKCLEMGCSHFLLMDCDEFYLEEELRYEIRAFILVELNFLQKRRAMTVIEKNDYDTTACRMRLFLKEPTYEYFPYDSYQGFLFSCHKK